MREEEPSVLSVLAPAGAENGIVTAIARYIGTRRKTSAKSSLLNGSREMSNTVRESDVKYARLYIESYFFSNKKKKKHAKYARQENTEVEIMTSFTVGKKKLNTRDVSFVWKVKRA